MKWSKRNQAVTIAICITAIALAAIAFLGESLRDKYLSHWPQVSAPELFVTSQPKPEDVVGNYRLSQQSITTNGLAFLEGREFQLDLRPDGTFATTNFPHWSLEPHPTPHIQAFVTTTGHWQFDKLGTVYIRKQPQPIWGIVFSSGTNAGIDALALRGKSPPYLLMMIYDDPDEGAVMTFTKN